MHDIAKRQILAVLLHARPIAANLHDEHMTDKRKPEIDRTSKHVASGRFMPTLSTAYLPMNEMVKELVGWELWLSLLATGLCCRM